MARMYDVVTLCPDGYNALKNKTAWEELGYESFEEFLETFELNEAEYSTFISKFKTWNSVVPSKYGTQDAYIIPTEMMEWSENMVLLDVNDMICDGTTGAYCTFLLSTEDWMAL